MRFKPLLVILIAFALGAAVLGLFWNVIRPRVDAASSQTSTTPARHLEEPNITFVDQIQGPKNAAITIVEFGDYLCPHCRTAEEAVQKLLATEPNRVRYVWKDMPAPVHTGADTAAEAGLCAAKQGAFWPFHRALFDIQGTYDETSLTFEASQAGLDSQSFVDCLKSHETKPLVERTLDEGKALGIDALPTFFINGKRYVGALTYEELVDATR